MKKTQVVCTRPEFMLIEVDGLDAAAAVAMAEEHLKVCDDSCHPGTTEESWTVLQVDHFDPGWQASLDAGGSVTVAVLDHDALEDDGIARLTWVDGVPGGEGE